MQDEKTDASGVISVISSFSVAWSSQPRAKEAATTADYSVNDGELTVDVGEQLTDYKGPSNYYED